MSVRKRPAHATADEDIRKIVAFGTALGFSFEEKEPAGSFLPGIRIQAGMTVCFDRRRLPSPGDLLHEMGHLAILPEPFRSRAEDDLEASLRPMVDEWFASNGSFVVADASGIPTENPVSRALLQAGEHEAQAWSFAAALACGVNPLSVFHRNAYGGAGRDIAVGLSLSHHPGINGMAAAGMCVRREYPVMRKWVQDAVPLSCPDGHSGLWNSAFRNQSILPTGGRH